MTKKQRRVVAIYEDFAECERGNVLLVHDDESGTKFNAWLRVHGNPGHEEGPEPWMDISWRPENYPSLNVTFVWLTDEELWKHLVKEFGTDWTIRKINLLERTETELREEWLKKEMAEDGTTEDEAPQV